MGKFTLFFRFFAFKNRKIIRFAKTHRFWRALAVLFLLVWWSTLTISGSVHTKGKHIAEKHDFSVKIVIFPHFPVIFHIFLYGDIWCYMVLYGVIWCYMVLYAVIRCYMMLYGGIWWHMVAYDGKIPRKSLKKPSKSLKISEISEIFRTKTREASREHALWTKTQRIWTFHDFLSHASSPRRLTTSASSSLVKVYGCHFLRNRPEKSWCKNFGTIDMAKRPRF